MKKIKIGLLEHYYNVNPDSLSAPKRKISRYSRTSIFKKQDIKLIKSNLHTKFLSNSTLSCFNIFNDSIKDKITDAKYFQPSLLNSNSTKSLLEKHEQGFQSRYTTQVVSIRYITLLYFILEKQDLPIKRKGKSIVTIKKPAI